MPYLIFCFLFAFIVSLALARPVSRLAVFLGAVDFPCERKRHAGAVSRLGGVGFFVAFAIAVLPLLLNGSPLLMRLLSAGLLILALGISDDIFSLLAWQKLVAQSVISWALWAMGMRIYTVSVFGISLSLESAASAVLTVALLVSLINAVNFLDGMDALATMLSLSTLFCISLLERIGHSPSVFISFALMGALVGFLPYNLSRASTFMGDCGSTFLGLALATLSIDAAQGEMSISLILLLLVPLANIGFVILRRIRRRKSLFSSDRLHIHHYLSDFGMSENGIVTLLTLLSLAAGLFAVAISLT